VGGEDEAGAEVVARAELADAVSDGEAVAEAPVPAGVFWRRCKAPSTSAAETIDSTTNANRSRHGSFELRNMPEKFYCCRSDLRATPVGRVRLG